MRSRILTGFLSGVLWLMAAAAPVTALVVVDPGAQDDTNGIAGIDRGDPANGVPPDRSLTTKRFRTLQGALYALRNNLISDTVIELRSVGPFNAREPGVPTGVPRDLDVAVGITIRGAGTVPTIIDGGNIGIRVSSSASVTLENLVIRNTASHGLYAQGAGTSGPNLTLRRVQVSRAGGSGIFVTRTTLNLEQVQVITAARHGIVVTNGSTLTGRNVRVTGAGADGVCVVSSSTSHLVDLEIRNGAGRGFVADNSPSNLIEGGKITNNTGGDGVYASNGSLLLIRGLGTTRSEVSDNTGNGVAYTRNSHGSVIDTDIDRNGARGISVRQTTNRMLFSDLNIRNNGTLGIFVSDTARLILRRLLVHRNGDFGVYLNLVTDALVENNRITENGAAGLFALGPATAIIRNNPEIRGNAGRGISLSDEMQGEITGNIIRGNEEGGVSLRRSPAEIPVSGNTIADNSRQPLRASLGAGIIIYEGSRARIVGNSISANHSVSSGGGIAVVDSTALVGGLNSGDKNKLVGNHAEDGVGGGLVCSGNSDLQFIGNDIVRNEAIHGAQTGAANGGGMAVLTGCKAIIRGNLFSLNTAQDHGGGLFVKDAPTTVIGGRQRNDVNNFNGNSATNGNGGGLLVEGGNNEIRGNNFERNTAASPLPDRGYGGGVAFFSGFSGQLLGNRMERNTAEAGGGVYARDSKPRIGDGTLFGENIILRNTATNRLVIGLPPAIGEGGGIALHNAEGAIIDQNTIGFNIGSGIHVSGGKLNTIRNNFIGRDRNGNAQANQGPGIAITASPDNTVGPRNTIANNRRDGIAIVGGTAIRNEMTQNIITANTGWGIRLSGGANGRPEPPVITEATATEIRGTIFQSPLSRVEVFQDTDNEAAEYLGDATVNADGTFGFAGTLANDGLNVTLTVTDPADNTSEIGNALLQLVRDGSPPPQDRTIDMTDPALTHVDFGRWGADAGAGLDGYVGGAVRNLVGNAANGWSNFIDRDPNRLYVRLRDYRLNSDPAAAETTTTDIATETVEQTTVLGITITLPPVPDDDRTEITLRESGNNTGIFVSESQLVMGPDVFHEPFTDANGNCRRDAGEAFTDLNSSTLHETDNPDDDFAVRSVTGLVCDDAPEDRSHRANVDGEVAVFYQPPGAAAVRDAKLSVPVCNRDPESRLRLNVMIYNFSEPWIDMAIPGFQTGIRDAAEPFMDISAGAAVFGAAGTWGPVWTNAQIDRQMLHLRAYLAIDCIRVHEIGRTVLNPGPVLFRSLPGRMDALGDPMGNPLSADELAIHPAMRSAVNLDASPNNDVVDMYMVPPLDAGFAAQWRPGFAAGQPIPATVVNMVFVGLNSATANVPGAFPHELGHQLTNTPDGGGPPRYMYFPSLGAAPGDSTNHTTLRRAQQATGTRIRTTPRPGVAAVGNNLLRAP